MKRTLKVVVALSGGVDSSVAAALLKDWGWEVCGVHFLLPSPPAVVRERVEMTTKVADHLGISLRIIDLRDEFERLIIDPFLDAYMKGMTPSPCVNCNPLIKFEALHSYAIQNGIHRVATGHYVRVRIRGGGEEIEVLRGRDRGKDQSYFLQRLTGRVLSKAVFPLGGFSKDMVRLLADDMGLPSRHRTESQEICFISGIDYRAFMEGRMGAGGRKGGTIVNAAGRELGTHRGIHRFTIGQRHGLGIASSRPYYVMEIRPELDQVVVGRREEIFSRTVRAREFNWIGGTPTGHEIRVEAQIRYRHRPGPGLLEVLSDSEARVVFDEPQWAVTPGQALACYRGDRLLGGGWIVKGKGPITHERKNGG